MSWRFGLGLAVLAALLFSVGCGGEASGGGESAGGESPNQALTKAEFIKQADVICEQVDEAQKAAINEYAEEHPNGASDPSLGKRLVLLTGLPPIRAGVGLLEELPPPEGDEKEVEAIIDALEEAVKIGEENPEALANLTKGAGPFTEPGRLAGSYGLKVCVLPL